MPSRLAVTPLDNRPDNLLILPNSWQRYVRYQRQRLESDAMDGCSNQEFLAAAILTHL